MAEYTDHLYCDTFPYLTPNELITCCKAAEGMETDDPRILDSIDDASTVIFYLTGKQFYGTCQATVRPPCLAGGVCGCGCSPYQINLGYWPVTQLNSVRYGGIVYTGANLTNTFHINEWHYLARNDGDSFISGNQWAIAGGTEDNTDNGYTFEVTLSHGLKIPRLLTRATRALACQWVEQCCSSGPCKLPQKVTNVSRSGISMDIASASDLLVKGRTGIYEVDLAIKVFNPSNLQSPSFIWSANTEHGRRVGT